MSNLPIIYEDDDILVVNKPAGIIVNRSDTTSHVETLQDLVEKYVGKPSPQPSPKVGEGDQGEESMWETPEDAFYNRSGIVHRLDKETSGIIIIAKTVDAFVNLQKQFKERLVEKTYLALSHGKIVPPSGEISVPVGRLTFNRKRFGVVAGGRPSITSYRVISNFQFSISKNKEEKFSFVELHPKTGRTHQIRVHLQYIGHPIFGDELYAGRKTAREDRKLLPRVFLHAATISFLHPTTGKRMECTAPLPQELQELLNKFS